MKTASTTIRTLIVDDHPVVRVGLKSMLSRQPGIFVAGAVSGGKEAISFLERSPVDVVLLDLRMPAISGIETLRTLRELHIQPRAIVLSSFESDQEIYQAVEAGAHGYLLKDMPSEIICAAIRTIVSGGTYFPPGIAKRLAERRLKADLSAREIEILQLVAKGLTNKQIGKMLNISQFTVRNHVNHIATKLDANDRTQAAFIALRSGILTVSN
jgi:two-component system NarL family response regulator